LAFFTSGPIFALRVPVLPLRVVTPTKRKYETRAYHFTDFALVHGSVGVEASAGYVISHGRTRCQGMYNFGTA
jgi:hypothetical protein